MGDYRSKIIEVGLATLREHGYAGFTQPRVAAGVGIRQSHLTYYYPTRLDMLTAVGRAAVDQQREAIEAMFASLKSLDQAALAIGQLVKRRENTRILLALAQAGDEEPRLRELFQELAAGIVTQIGGFLERIGHAPKDAEGARAIHALSVGLAVVDLATGFPNSKQRAAGILRFAFASHFGNAVPASRRLASRKSGLKTSPSRRSSKKT